MRRVSKLGSGGVSISIYRIRYKRFKRTIPGQVIKFNIEKSYQIITDVRSFRYPIIFYLKIYILVKRYSVKVRSKNNQGLAPPPLCKTGFSGWMDTLLRGEDISSKAPTGLDQNIGAAVRLGKSHILFKYPTSCCLNC